MIQDVRNVENWCIANRIKYFGLVAAVTGLESD